MQKYIVIGECLAIKAGQKIKLDENQVKRRKHLMKICGKDVYEVLIDFHLKKNEEFESDNIFTKKSALIVETKKAYDEKPISEKLEDLTKVELIKFAKKNCKGLTLNPKAKREDMIEEIATFPMV
jgi:hypothetical protein